MDILDKEELCEVSIVNQQKKYKKLNKISLGRS